MGKHTNKGSESLPYETSSQSSVAPQEVVSHYVNHVGMDYTTCNPLLGRLSSTFKKFRYIVPNVPKKFVLGHL